MGARVCVGKLLNLKPNKVWSQFDFTTVVLQPCLHFDMAREVWGALRSQNIEFH